MSKIKNDGSDQYGAEPFERQQFGTASVEGVKRKINLIYLTPALVFVVVDRRNTGPYPSKLMHQSLMVYNDPKRSFTVVIKFSTSRKPRNLVDWLRTYDYGHTRTDGFCRR